MSIEGFKPIPVRKLGSLVTRYPAEILPLGVSPEARNVKFVGQAIETRDGLDSTYGMQIPNANMRVTGLAVLTRSASVSPWQTNTPVVYGSDGTLWRENPVGSGALESVTVHTGAALATGNYLEEAAAYNRLYFAFGDLIGGNAEPKHYDGTYLDPVGVTPNASPPVLVAHASTGNVQSGTRYGVWMYRTRTGHIAGFTRAAMASVTLADGTHRIHVSGLPAIGSIPLNVTDIIVAFTLSGSTQDDDFFYIGADASIGGISMTTTILPVRNSDGTPSPLYDTTGVFNFTDLYLAASTVVTRGQFRTKLANQTSVAYLPSLDRFAWCGEPGFNGFRLSEPVDPETFYSTTGYVQPGPNDGQRPIGAIELDNGEILFLKQRSAYSPVPTTGAPTTWELKQRWDTIGPCGPRAFDKFKNILVFAHRSGVYIYQGARPELLNYEIEENNSGFESPAWTGINWEFEHLIWVRVDNVTKTVYIGVPYAQAVVPNLIFKCSFADGFASAIVEANDGTLRVSEGRKWSIDDISAHEAVRVWRTLVASTNPQTPVDREIATTQLLFASSNSDGLVNVLNPTSKTDNNHRIAMLYRTAFIAPFLRNRLGGILVTLRGNGMLQTSITNGRGSPILRLLDVETSNTASSELIEPDEVGDRWMVLLENGAQDGDWIVVEDLELYLNEFWDS